MVAPDGIDRMQTVLIVDDQAAYRDAADLVVELADGFERVGFAESGEDAIQLAAALHPDVVLMDVNLPGIDGFEATRQILAADPGARVVVLSTYSGEEYGERARAVGAVAFVSKGDFGPDSLAALVA